MDPAKRETSDNAALLLRQRRSPVIVSFVRRIAIATPRSAHGRDTFVNTTRRLTAVLVYSFVSVWYTYSRSPRYLSAVLVSRWVYRRRWQLIIRRHWMRWSKVC